MTSFDFLDVQRVDEIRPAKTKVSLITSIYIRSQLSISGQQQCNSTQPTLLLRFRPLFVKYYNGNV